MLAWADGEWGEAHGEAHSSRHTACSALLRSTGVVQTSREMDVSGQKGSSGKCHNSRPMVDSAPDLRRLCLYSTRTRSFAESPTLEEATREPSPSIVHPDYQYLTIDTFIMHGQACLRPMAITVDASVSPHKQSTRLRTRGGFAGKMHDTVHATKVLTYAPGHSLSS